MHASPLVHRPSGQVASKPPRNSSSNSKGQDALCLIRTTGYRGLGQGRCLLRVAADELQPALRPTLRQGLPPSYHTRQSGLRQMMERGNRETSTSFTQIPSFCRLEEGHLSAARPTPAARRGHGWSIGPGPHLGSRYCPQPCPCAHRTYASRLVPDANVEAWGALRRHGEHDVMTT